MEKFLEQVSDKSKVAGYNTQKSTGLLYTTTEKLKFEIINTMSFILTTYPTKLKYLGIKLFKCIIYTRKRTKL